jgi:asparagine synthase (glutamine-hydrolysing)
MVRALSHRGPDDWGYYLSPDQAVGLYHTRLSIIDVERGAQPLCNEDGTVWVSFNGEIYQHAELMADLQARGHRFRTRSDTEVIVHLYEEYGEEFVHKLRGEFAIALYDENDGVLRLIRDRFGIKPLYYHARDDGLVFASELKALAARGDVPMAFDHAAVLNYLCALPLLDRSLFRDIRQVPPGTLLRVSTGSVQAHRYWDLEFAPEQAELREVSKKQERESLAEFRALFDEAVRIRLVADVPVGVYLSGGLDSSAVTASLRRATNNELKAFTVGFSEAEYDESTLAQSIARHIGVDWHRVIIGSGDLAEHFPASVWHAEIAVPTSNGAAKFVLSRLAQQHVKVVLTGEGSDELLCGYMQFKHQRLLEAQLEKPRDANIRRALRDFTQQTAGTPYLVSSSATRHYEALAERFGTRPYPALRAAHFQGGIRFLQSRAAAKETRDQDVLGLAMACLDLDHLRKLSPLSATQYVLFKTDLPFFLLSYLGDREEMAHSVEGRVPFLDHKLVEFATRLPAQMKLRGETEKYALHAAFDARLPKEMRAVSKRMFLAPTLDTLGFFTEGAFGELLSAKRIEEAGVFSARAVAFLKFMARHTKKGSVKYKHYEGALTYVLSIQLLHDMFIRRFSHYLEAFQREHASYDPARNRVSRAYLEQPLRRVAR